MQKVERHFTSPWITLAILSGLGIVVMSSETMVLPAIPEFIVDLDISYDDSSWILVAPLVTGAVMTPIAGKLSDTYGKKRMLLIILGIFILGLLIGSSYNQFSFPSYCQGDEGHWHIDVSYKLLALYEINSRQKS